MCDNCEKIRDEMWTEIRDLLNYNRKLKGPLAEELAQHLELIQEQAEEAGREIDDDEMAVFTEALRAELIAMRCAFIARTCDGTEWKGHPPSFVLGAWAGQSMQMEQANSLAANLLRRLFED